MRVRPTFLARFATLLAAGCAALLAAPARAADAAPPARVIVKFKAEAADATVRALAYAPDRERAAAVRRSERVGALSHRAGIALASGVAVGERAQAVRAAGLTSEQLAARLAAQPDVEYAVVDGERRIHAAPNDPLYAANPPAPFPAAGQWYLRAPTAEARSAINAEAAWNVSTGRSAVVVAVLDTGVRFDHEDLRRVADGGNLLPGYDFISNEAWAGDGGGRDADATDVGDSLSQAEKNDDAAAFQGCDVTPASSWHGTRMASLVAAATDNGLGMAGVARGVRVLPVRVIGKCKGQDSDILAAMRWAAGIRVDGVPDNPNPAQIVNLSLGGGGACSASYVEVINELTARNVLVVASAGNDNGLAVGAPANCLGAFGVTAVRHAGTKLGVANLGPQVALSAPGGNCVNDAAGPCLYPVIAATNPGTATAIAGASSYSSGADQRTGTSFAAPLVSGTAALLLSAQPALTPADLRSVLRQTARPFPTTGGDLGDGSVVPVCSAPSGFTQLQCYCTTATCGAGMLDAGAALNAVAVVARITASTATPFVNQPLTLSGATSLAATGRSIVGWQWSIAQDAGGISGGFIGSAAGPDVALRPIGAGQFTVALTVTDSAGAQSTTTSQIGVLTNSPGVTPGGGGGGGGAVGAGWLAGLGAAAAALAAVRRRAA